MLQGQLQLARNRLQCGTGSEQLQPSPLAPNQLTPPPDPLPGRRYIMLHDTDAHPMHLRTRKPVRTGSEPWPQCTDPHLTPPNPTQPHLP